MAEVGNLSLKEHLMGCFMEKEKGGFPFCEVNFPQLYLETEKYLNKKLHPQVVSGAAANGSGYLTDHGPRHVGMVIQRASLLLGKNISRLSGYETFLLLLAIHFHDVGNALGRETHERQIAKVMTECKLSSDIDTAVRRLIVKIAAAHGGKTDDGSKDTIGEIEPEVFINGVQVRPALLAAILRFADELADDHTRTNELMNNINAIPEENRIYHLYSSCLQPVGISGRSINFQFDLNRSDVCKTFLKDNEECYLYDEILMRMKKCYCELLYCSRYAEGLLNFSAINVSISVFDDNTGFTCLYKDTFSLRICGYPDDAVAKPITSILKTGLKCLNGGQLKKMLEREEA